MTNVEDNKYIDRLARQSRVSAVAGLLGIVIFFGSLAYSYYSLRGLEKRQADLETRRAELQQQVGSLEVQKKDLEAQKTKLEQDVRVAAKARLFAVAPNAEKQAIAKPESSSSVIYIHITNEQQRSEAQKISDLLVKDGYITPGIVLVSVTLTMTDVRYFHHDDEKVADAIGAELQKLGIRDIRPRFIPGFESKVPPGQFEVWLSNSFMAPS